MDARISPNGVSHFPNFQTPRCLLETSLHLPLLEPPQISAGRGGGAVGELSGDFLESPLSRFDVHSEMFDKFQRLLARSSDFPLHSANGASRIFVFEDVTSFHFLPAVGDGFGL